MLEKFLSTIEQYDLPTFINIEKLKSSYAVYLTHNTINNKIYIGYTSKPMLILQDKYKGSGKYFHYSVKKYGWSAFQSIILAVFETSEEAFNLERLIVNEDFVKNKQTYNVKVGGSGGWNHWLLDEEKAKIVKTKQVATMKKNKRLGKTYLTNSLVDDPERNRRFRETLQLAHKNPTTRKRHSVASKKNWESEEYRAKIPKRKRGFKPMYKNGKYIQVYQDKLQQYLDDGWIIKGRYITSEEQKEKRIESLKSTLNSPEYKKKLSEKQKAWFAIPEKKQNMLMLRNKTNSFYQMIYTEHLTDESTLLTHYLFCQEMIRLCKTHKIKKFSVTKRTITSGSVFGKIILTYSKLEVATIHQNINCLIQYAKTILEYDKVNRQIDEKLIQLEEQLFSFIDKDLKLPKHLKLSSYL